MSLEAIAAELFLEIVSYLRPEDIERLALTLNHAITHRCMPLLAGLFSRRRSAKRMIERFGPPPLGVRPTRLFEYVPSIALDKFDLDPEEIIKQSYLPPLDYIDFNEDLEWLLPLDEGTAKGWSIYDRGPAMEEEMMDAFFQKTSELGIKLPPSFIKLAKDYSLQQRIVSMTANYFRVEGPFLCPAAVDDGAGGFIFRNWNDQQGCYFWYLYIEPGDEGGHCILGSASDVVLYVEDDMDEDELREWHDEHGITESDKDRAKELGIKVALLGRDDVAIEHTNFERWLAEMYYSEWLSFIGKDTKVIQENLKEYVRQMYTSRGNRQILETGEEGDGVHLDPQASQSDSHSS